MPNSGSDTRKRKQRSGAEEASEPGKKRRRVSLTDEGELAAEPADHGERSSNKRKASSPPCTPKIDKGKRRLLESPPGAPLRPGKKRRLTPPDPAQDTRSHAVLGRQLADLGKKMLDRPGGSDVLLPLLAELRVRVPRHQRGRVKLRRLLIDLKANGVSDQEDSNDKRGSKAKKVGNRRGIKRGSFEKSYRRIIPYHDEFVSTATVRELFMEAAAGIKSDGQLEVMTNILELFSLVRVPTTMIGFKTKNGVMQHPAPKGKGMFAESKDTMSEHYELDVDRRRHVVDAIEDAYQAGGSAADMAIAAVQAAIIYTANHMWAPATANNVSPRKKDPAAKMAQAKQREEWKDFVVEKLGAVQRSRKAGPYAGPWTPGVKGKNVSPPRRRLAKWRRRNAWRRTQERLRTQIMAGSGPPRPKQGSGAARGSIRPRDPDQA